MSRLPVISESEEVGGEEEVEDERDTLHAEQGDGTDPPPVASSSIAPALFTPYPNLAVDTFLTDDNGAPLVIESTGDAPAIPLDAPSSFYSAPSSWLGQISSRVFSESTSTLSTVASRLARASSRLLHGSAASVDSVAGHLSSNLGQRTLKLSEFCDVIGQCASLERAKILSVECYREWTNLSILHRALIFHIRREGRSDVWLRVDRLRSHQTSRVEFLRRGGKTEANDLAHLAGTKSHLLRRLTAKPENTIEFGSPPNLGVFRFCLQIICEELLEYHLWPQNCWFMCSLLQEHLFEVGDGSFQHGRHIYQHLAPRVRTRVWNRVYHLLPEPPTVVEMLAQLPSSKDYNQAVVDLRTLLGDQDVQSTGRLSAEQGGNIMRAIHDLHQSITSRQTKSNADVGVTASHLLLHALSLERQGHGSPTPSSSSHRMKTLASYGKYLLSSGDLDPVRLHLLDMHREQYRANPDQHWEDLAFHLARMARNARNVDPTIARACITETQDLLIQHSSGPKLWIGSQVLKGHTGDLNCVAFSPDGKQIASASDDKTIRRWDAMTGESIGEPMRGHSNSVYTVAFSPDGTQIVSGSEDRTLRRWDAFSGEPVGPPMRGHTDSVLSVAYSPDGKVIVSGSVDRMIRRWDASTGETIGEPLKGHTDSVWSVAFSPDGKRIASGSDDQTIRLCDAITGEAIGEPWKGHTGHVYSVAFSPDGKFIVSGSYDHTVRRWDALTGESIGAPMTGHTGSVYCVAVSPDGKQIASGSYKCTIRIWDASTGEQIGEPLEGHTGPVESVAFSPDGRQIVSASSDRTVRIWDSLEDLDRWTESV